MDFLEPILLELCLTKNPGTVLTCLEFSLIKPHFDLTQEQNFRSCC